MKYLFIVQGEGRGHMTQAITLLQLLEKNGHEVAHVIVGKSARRQIPTFFTKAITAPLSTLESPNFVTDKKERAVSVPKTFFYNLSRFSTYLKSVQRIDQIVHTVQPDRIINFYDFLGGLYFLLKKPKIPHLAIAHQFLLNHADFEFPKGKSYDKISLLAGNRLASYGAEKKGCLSFQPMPNQTKDRLYILPPLLREQVKQIKAEKGTHFLIYLVNPGYSDQIKAFHEQHPDIPLHCFWDQKEAPNEWVIDENLTFHQLDDQKFLQLMSTCRGYLTTAGFESVCEAMYFDKPVLMVPVEGHYEQACNALDAQKAGAGIFSDTFDLRVLLDYLPKHQPVGKSFQQWCEQSEKVFLEWLT